MIDSGCLESPTGGAALNKRGRVYILASSLLVIVVISYLIATKRNNEPGIRRVGITQFTSHPALDAVRRGVESGLVGDGSSMKFEIIFRNANADFTTASKIASEFASLRLDLLIPITTVSAQPIAKACPTTPIVFAGVTDPVGAGLVESLDRPGHNKPEVATYGHLTNNSNCSNRYFHR